MSTEDAGTIGVAQYKLESTIEYEKNSTATKHEKTNTMEIGLTYGLTEHTEISLTFPYRHVTLMTQQTTQHFHGISDVKAGIKSRFYEFNAISVAIRGGVQFPTGDESNHLGSGHYNPYADIICSYESAVWSAHIDTGYIRKQSTSPQREHLWHISAAITYQMHTGWKLLAEIALDRAQDPAAVQNPAFSTIGLSSQLSKDWKLALGYRQGLNAQAIDHSVMAGLNFYF